MQLGAHTATMPTKIFRQLMKHPLTDSGIERFLSDWADVENAERVNIDVISYSVMIYSLCLLGDNMSSDKLRKLLDAIDLSEAANDPILSSLASRIYNVDMDEVKPSSGVNASSDEKNLI